MMEQLLLAVEMTGAYRFYLADDRARPDSENVRARFLRAYLHERALYRAALECIYPLGLPHAKEVD